MREKLLLMVIKQLFAGLGPSVVKPALDDAFDWVEAYVEKTDTEIDDAIAVPIINQLRVELDIPDDYDGDED